jgi:hypothetical protein
MTLRAYSFLVFVFVSSTFSYSQLTIREVDFNSKTVLSKIFHGEFQDDNNVQKWPVSSVQALELNGYVDGKNFSYTLVDTIFNLKVDTTNYKIVVFATFQVDSSGSIQDCMGCPPLIGLASFSKIGNEFELSCFNLNLIQQGHGLFIPYSRIEQIGLDKYALVFKEEIVQDWGVETWFELFKEGFPLFLTYDYSAYVPSENSYIIENSIEIVKTENDYYDLIVQSKKIPTEIIGTDKAAKIKPLITKLSPSLNDKKLRVQIPFGYSVQPK